MLHSIKHYFAKLFESRIRTLRMVFILFFLLLAGRLFYLQVVKGDQYYDSYILKTKKTIYTPAVRGRIFDRKGVLLAYNEVKYSLGIRDDGTYKTQREKNNMALRLVRLLEENKISVKTIIPITLDSEGRAEFSGSSGQVRQLIMDTYGKERIRKWKDNGKDVYKQTADEVLKDLGNLNFGFRRWKEGSEITPKEKLGVLNIRLMLARNMFQRYKSAILCTNLTDEEKALFLEHEDEIRGIAIEESTHRVYTHPYEFSHILGYVGDASAEDLKDLKKKKDSYELGDTVGKAGIEKYMENELSGTKGTEEVILNSTGKIIKHLGSTKAIPGKDVYLSIDAENQISTYRLLELRLAAIIMEKLVMEDVEFVYSPRAEDYRISVKDAYVQILLNHVLNEEAFRGENASDSEKKMVRLIDQRIQDYLPKLKSMLEDPKAPTRKDLAKDMQSSEEGVVEVLGKMDLFEKEKGEKTLLKQYEDGKINLRSYLYGLVREGLLKPDRLEEEHVYADTNSIFEALKNEILKRLPESEDFRLAFYKNAIKDGSITGNDILLAMFHQGILKDNPEEMALLSQGRPEDAYQIFRKHFDTLEITPAMLAMDPCSGATIVTSVDDGSLLALVSYPGYDINRFSGSVDPEYYKKLTNDLSIPLYNRATQTRVSPGSTYKMLSSVAALQEGVITPETEIDCQGIYPETGQRCWIYDEYNKVHGWLNVVGAIKNSCNIFFYDVGTRLGRIGGTTFRDNEGIQKLRKYAELFGLGEKSGVEIPEISPKISDQYAVSSAIGQGNNSYAAIHLSRYITAIATKGNLYKYTLLDHTKDPVTGEIHTYHPELHKIQGIKSEVWPLLWQGMYDVTHGDGSSAYAFADSKVDVLGKTGTAQEVKSRPNHAHFVGFGPYQHVKYATAVTIPHGFAAGNAAKLTNNLFAYLEGYMTKKDIETVTVSQISMGFRGNSND